MSRNFIDLSDQRFGKWVVIRQAKRDRHYNRRWLCRCDCGRERIVIGSCLRSGKSKGCQSCQVKQQQTIHGQARTHLYRNWQEMIQRCENLNNICYKNYGGREIRVCSEWRKSFITFRKWALANGYEEGLTIDRINNDGDYTPENCQFLTRSDNVRKAWHVDGSYKERHLTVS